VNNENLTNINETSFDVTYELKGTQFVWDNDKSKMNYQKHRITFEEAPEF